MKVRPIGNRVLVQPLTREEVTKSGIILPATADKEKKAQGKIIALGSGDEVEKLGLKVGDTVVFGKYAGEEVEIEEEGQTVEYKILSVGEEKEEGEVLAVIE